MMERDAEFVWVELTEAAGPELRASNGPLHFHGRGGQPAKVLRTDWEAFLSQLASSDNQALVRLAKPPVESAAIAARQEKKKE